MKGGYHCRRLAKAIGANTLPFRTIGQKGSSTLQQFQKAPGFEGRVFAYSAPLPAADFELQILGDRTRRLSAPANSSSEVTRG